MEYLKPIFILFLLKAFFVVEGKGINEVFNFYSEYIEEINDDSFLKR